MSLHTTHILYLIESDRPLRLRKDASNTGLGFGAQLDGSGQNVLAAEIIRQRHVHVILDADAVTGGLFEHLTVLETNIWL